MTRAQVKPLLQLPVLTLKFMQPKQISDPNEFFTRWRSLGPGMKLQEVIQVKPVLANAGLPGVTALFNSLKLNVVPGLDPNPNNLVSACLFR